MAEGVRRANRGRNARRGGGGERPDTLTLLGGVMHGYCRRCYYSPMYIVDSTLGGEDCASCFLSSISGSHLLDYLITYTPWLIKLRIELTSSGASEADGGLEKIDEGLPIEPNTTLQSNPSNGEWASADKTQRESRPDGPNADSQGRQNIRWIGEARGFEQYLNEGREHFFAGLYQDAISLLKGALREGAPGDEACLLLGRAYLAVAQSEPDSAAKQAKTALQNAVIALLEAVKRQPENARALFSLGVVYSMLGWPSHAVKVHSELQGLNPEAAKALAEVLWVDVYEHLES